MFCSPVLGHYVIGYSFANSLLVHLRMQLVRDKCIPSPPVISQHKMYWQKMRFHFGQY